MASRPEVGETIKIELTRGAFSVIDKEDHARISQHSWCLLPTGYAQSRIDGKAVYLHRFILDAPGGMQVDHINRNPLDNRKLNLRLCSHRENHCNLPAGRGQSKYKGVRKFPSGRWGAYIKVQYKQLHLGTFDSEDEAARAYDIAATKYFGEFASPNFEATNA